jgi:hypothetical protein
MRNQPIWEVYCGICGLLIATGEGPHATWITPHNSECPSAAVSIRWQREVEPGDTPEAPHE